MGWLRSRVAALTGCCAHELAALMGCCAYGLAALIGCFAYGLSILICWWLNDISHLVIFLFISYCILISLSGRQCSTSSRRGKGDAYQLARSSDDLALWTPRNKLSSCRPPCLPPAFPASSGSSSGSTALSFSWANSLIVRMWCPQPARCQSHLGLESYRAVYNGPWAAHKATSLDVTTSALITQSLEMMTVAQVVPMSIQQLLSRS